jgi:acyl-CoA synthetase (AMP-forming)/AMP-acid ligase II
LIAHRRDDRRAAYVEGRTGRTLTWSDLAACAADWAAKAEAFHLDSDLNDDAGPAGSLRVGLLVADPVAMAAMYLGALAAGVTAAPLDPNATASELAAKVKALGLAAVITGDDPISETDMAWLDRRVELWHVGPLGLSLVRARAASAPPVSGTGAALILASSGTTGEPKVIPLELTHLVHTARGVVAHHRLTPEDCGYNPLPLSHINGLVVGVLAGLVGGHRLVLERRFSVSSCWDIVADHGVTWLNFVPPIISILATRPAPPREIRSRVRFARSASAPLAVTSLEAFEARTGILVVETYGLTEAASQVTANPLTRRHRKVGSVGVPVGTELRVVGEGRHPRAAGAVGQVEIRGTSVISHYLSTAGSPAWSRPARQPDGWLPTGDLGYLDPDGYLYLVGRIDDVINRGGEKIYPREIEEVILADPAVEVAVVVARRDPILEEVPVAFVRDRGSVGPSDLVERLADRCRHHLSRHRRPVEIIISDDLPMGPNGKVRRSELRRRLNRSSECQAK